MKPNNFVVYLSFVILAACLSVIYGQSCQFQLTSLKCFQDLQNQSSLDIPPSMAEIKKCMSDRSCYFQVRNNCAEEVINCTFVAYEAAGVNKTHPPAYIQSLTVFRVAFSQCRKTYPLCAQDSKFNYILREVAHSNCRTRWLELPPDNYTYSGCFWQKEYRKCFDELHDSIFWNDDKDKMLRNLGCDYSRLPDICKSKAKWDMNLNGTEDEASDSYRASFSNCAKSLPFSTATLKPILEEIIFKNCQRRYILYRRRTTDSFSGYSFRLAFKKCLEEGDDIMYNERLHQTRMYRDLGISCEDQNNLCDAVALADIRYYSLPNHEWASLSSKWEVIAGAGEDKICQYERKFKDCFNKRSTDRMLCPIPSVTTTALNLMKGERVTCNGGASVLTSLVLTITSVIFILRSA